MSIKPHKPYRWDVDVSGIEFPADFLFGVCNSPFHSEGHYNGEGDPCNQWALWERSGQVETSGIANDFWNDWQQHVDVSKSIGLNAFRMGFDWTRIQPTTDPAHGLPEGAAPPPFEPAAWDRYAEILRSVFDADMEPVITIYHFIQPSWVGTELWVDERPMELFQKFARRTVREVNRRLVDTGYPAIRFWVTFNEPGIPPQCTHLNLEHPHNPDKAGYPWALKAQDGIMAGHVRLYNAIHDLYEEEGWRTPAVGYNTVANALYEHDKAFSDLIRCRERGIAAGDSSALAAYLAEKRAAHYQVYDRIAHRRFPDGDALIGRFNRMKTRAEEDFNPLDMNLTRSALTAASRSQVMDYVAINIYDPFLPVMGGEDPAGADGSPASTPKWWEWVHERATYTDHLELYGSDLDGLPLYVLEASIGHEQPKGASRGNPRPDGLSREQYLKESLGEVLRAISKGIDVRGYLYWTLCDNYEWGTYTNRLGLLDFDFENLKILKNDGLGARNGEIYRRLITAMRSGDESAIDTAFSRLESQ